jgi:hypothetical protein
MVGHWHRYGEVEVAPGIGVEVVVPVGDSGDGYHKSIANTIGLDARWLEQAGQIVEQRKAVDRKEGEGHKAIRAAVGFRVPLRGFWQRKGRLRRKESFDPL